MSSAFPDAARLAGPCVGRRPRFSERITRALASTAAWLPDFRAQGLADASARSGVPQPARLPQYPTRVPGDVLAGQPAVVIPLNRAVVCGEDHVYDVGQFSVCPNCAAEERLPLIELLAHQRTTLVAIQR